MWRTEHGQLFDMCQLPDVDFLGELSSDRGFHVFAGPEAATGQRPTSRIGFPAAPPEEYLE